MKASWASRFSALSLVLNGVIAANSSTTTAYLSDDYVDLGIVSEAYEKAKTFVSGLTSSEKISIITASSFTGNASSWTKYQSADGVGGINKLFYVSAFPMPNALTMTWNRELIAAQFKALGDEYFASGYSFVDGGPVLGPLGRVPEGGRQNEAFSPDPYLSGISVAQAVIAQGNAGVIPCVRHFVLYEQESNRTGAMGGSSSVSTVYSSNADDKTLHELYMFPWADAINSGALSVMCSMNLVNGTHSCENNGLLSGKLKRELGFPGFVTPDAEAQFTAYGSANAGVDYSAYSVWTQDNILAGISNGSLPSARLDDMAIRTVMPYYYVGLDTADLPTVVDSTAYRNVRGNHSTLIREVGGEAIALLKNNVTGGGGLPLNKPDTISLFGAHAGAAMAGPNYAFGVQGTSADVYQGHLATGGGSGDGSLPYLVTPFNSITQHAIDDNSMLWWIMNNTFTSTDSSSMIPGIGGGTGVTPSITAYAENSAVCLVFINSWSGEGADRSALYDTEQDELVSEVAGSCNNTVVVVNISGPRVLDAWATHENVTAIIYSGLLGQESGNAIADVLYGVINPSGKLIHTIAKNSSDYPAAVCQTVECPFDEGINIDYRWFDAQDIEPRYPFGHGLSYTTFTYGAVSANITNSTVLASKYPTGALGLGGQADLFDDVIVVTTTVTNSGSLDGAEVAQLYISFPDEAEQSPRILRGFEKMTITTGATADVSFTLRRRDISYWDSSVQSWAIASGEYTFAVGASSRDIHGNTTLTI